MKRNSIYVYIAASLAMLVPVPGRFACGLILVVLFNLLMVSGTFLLHAVRMMKIESLTTVIITTGLIAVTILVKQILILYSPVLALTLGFSLFLPTLSSVIIGYFFDVSDKTIKQDLSTNMIQSCFFSIFALLFFLFRDIVSYGTVTFPSRTGFFTWSLPYDETKLSVVTFFASIPGALVLVAVVLAVFVHISHKFDCIERIQK
jgi:hypothetical protein